MRPSHLQEAVACGDDVAKGKLLEALDAFVSICEDGALPPAAGQVLASANLVLL